MTRIGSVAALTFVVLLLSSAAPMAQQNKLEAQMRDVLQRYLDKYAIPGATAAIAFPDGHIISTAVGLADVENKLPMAPETRMLAASIGKTFVGTLALALESDGYFDRHDLVGKYLASRPWFVRLPNASTMTIQHLLTHTSGLPDHVHLEGIGPELMRLSRAADVNLETLVSFVLDDEPLFEAGEAWSYTDTGYLILGMMIEEATGHDFFDLANDYLLGPNDLGETIPSNSAHIPNLAVGYTDANNPFGLSSRTTGDDGLLVWNPKIEWTGGGFASTSMDLARWGHALFNGIAMTVPYLERLLDGVAVHSDSQSILYGTGVAIYAETDYGTVYGHGGWIPGYVSSLRHYAEHNITVAFQVNSDVGIADDSQNFVSELETDLVVLAIQFADRSP